MIPRPQYIKHIKNGFLHNPIVILLGTRQVGKTTLMQICIFFE